MWQLEKFITVRNFFPLEKSFTARKICHSLKMCHTKENVTQLQQLVKVPNMC